jgi:pimeloyl-ACP methyl ester carboxylesterase
LGGAGACGPGHRVGGPTRDRAVALARFRPAGGNEPAAAFGHVYDPDWVERSRTALEAKADLTQYITDIAVADVEDIRARLGYETISLYGVSFGTRLAQAYLRRHPDRVRAVILDGVVPVDRVGPLTFAKTGQQALDRAFAACAANPTCRAAHPRPADDFDALMRRLAAAPALTVVRAGARFETVTMNAGDFAYAIRGLLYGRGPAVEALPDMIAHALATGDLSQFAQQYLDREVRMEASLAFGVHFSVLCAEDVPFIADADIPSATAGTFLASALSRNHPGLLARSGPPSLDSVHLVRVLQFLSRENGSIGARQSSSPNDGRGRRIHGPPRVETATALTVATTPHPAGVREPRFRRPFPHIHIFLGGPLFESTSGSFLPSGEVPGPLSPG